MKPQTIEDLERAAWFARLAFGVYPESDDIEPVVPKKPAPVFYVIP